jgi:hypothetical protein
MSWRALTGAAETSGKGASYAAAPEQASELSLLTVSAASSKGVAAGVARGKGNMEPGSQLNIAKWDHRHWAVYDGPELVCVTVYKIHSSKC